MWTAIAVGVLCILGVIGYVVFGRESNTDSDNEVIQLVNKFSVDNTEITIPKSSTTLDEEQKKM